LKSFCPDCEERLETPLGCNGCGALLDPEALPGPFVVFGLEPTWEIDERDLKRRLRRIGRLVHPDFHATDPERRSRAESNSARLNRAYEVLLDPFLRADWLIELLGGPSEKEERAMPPEFLMEVMEWNEALDEAAATPLDSPERTALEGLANTLLAERDRRLEAVGGLLTPLPPAGSPSLTQVRRDLNAVRYLSRALYKIRDLRYGTPTS